MGENVENKVENPQVLDSYLILKDPEIHEYGQQQS